MSSDANIERHACGAWITAGSVCQACANHYGLCPVCGKNRRPQLNGKPTAIYCSDFCRKHAHAHGVGVPRDGVYNYKIEHGEWTEAAHCATVDLDLWFPVGKEDVKQTELAVGICNACPVKVPCLLEGMQNKFGIWGGWTEDQRKELANRLEKIPSNIHKTVIAAAAKSGPQTLNSNKETK